MDLLILISFFYVCAQAPVLWHEIPIAKEYDYGLLSPLSSSYPSDRSYDRFKIPRSAWDENASSFQDCLKFISYTSDNESQIYNAKDLYPQQISFQDYYKTPYFKEKCHVKDYESYYAQEIYLTDMTIKLCKTSNILCELTKFTDYPINKMFLKATLVGSALYYAPIIYNDLLVDQNASRIEIMRSAEIICKSIKRLHSAWSYFESGNSSSFLGQMIKEITEEQSRLETVMDKDSEKSAICHKRLRLLDSMLKIFHASYAVESCGCCKSNFRIGR